MLLGVRGFPLGEHRRVGGVDRRLHADQLHVPWMVRFPDGARQLGRIGRLVSPLDLSPTLVEWVGAKVERRNITLMGGARYNSCDRRKTVWRDSLLSASVATGERAIRTLGWSLLFDERAERRELFVRPDDRWEANDVAALCPDVMDELIEMARNEETRIRAGDDLA